MPHVTVEHATSIRSSITCDSAYLWVSLRTFGAPPFLVLFRCWASSSITHSRGFHYSATAGCAAVGIGYCYYYLELPGAHSSTAYAFQTSGWKPHSPAESDYTKAQLRAARYYTTATIRGTVAANHQTLHFAASYTHAISPRTLQKFPSFGFLADRSNAASTPCSSSI